MFKMKFLLMILCLIIALCGCQNLRETEEVPKFSDNYITINEKKFPLEEINEGIKNTFNSVLYYYGNDDTSDYITANKDIILNKEIKYELYLEPNSNEGIEAVVSPQKIYFVITNVQHPLSTTGDLRLYEFGIDITELGLRSDFSYQGHVLQGEKYSFIGDQTVYLGTYTMLIDEIKKPDYEKMDDEWKKKVEAAIRLYMDRNNFYSDRDDNLASGKYRIYVQSFFKSDKDSTIIFENENGDIYVGDYYFVHDIAATEPADLNNVMLNMSSDEKTFTSYLEKVHSDPAIAMEYSIAGQSVNGSLS